MRISKISTTDKPSTNFNINVYSSSNNFKEGYE